MPIGYFPRNNRAGELLGQGLSAFGQNFMAARDAKREQKRQGQADRMQRTSFEYGHPGFHFLQDGEAPPEQGPGEIITAPLPSARTTPTAFEANFVPQLPAPSSGSAIQRMNPERFRFFDGAYENVDERTQATERDAAARSQGVFQDAFQRARGTVAADPTQPAYRTAQTAKLNFDMAKPAKIEAPVMGSPEWLAAQDALAKLRAKYRPAPTPTAKPDPTQVVVTPTGIAIVNKKDATSRRVAAPTEEVAGGEQLQAAQRNPLKAKAIENRTQLAVLDRAIKELEAHPKSIGLRRAIPLVGETVNQFYDPTGTDARAALANIGSLKVHERSGASVTISEAPRLKPFIPSTSDQSPAALSKLKQLREFLMGETEALEAGGGSGSAPPSAGGGVAAKYGITPSKR